MPAYKAPSAAQVSAKLKRYQEDPVLFSSEILGFEPWDKQSELMHLVRSKNFVSCRSGHKVGKTSSMASIALWFITCFPRSVVVMTAPTASQIENQIWGEVRRLYRDAALRGFPIGGKMNETPWSGLRFADQRHLYGRSTKTKENFAGISAPNLLILVDEASGVSEDIFEAIFGNLASNGRVVLISNPTQTSGRFYDSFHGDSDQWATMHIPSTATPNFHGRSVDGLARPEWAEFMGKTYGNPSPYYDVRVLGNFPTQAENSVIPLGLVESSVSRRKLLAALEKGSLSPVGRAEASGIITQLEPLIYPAEPLVVGVDVARYGDDSSCFTPVRGLRMDEPKIITKFDIVDVAGHAYEFTRGLARPGEIPLVRVDANGIGSGVYDNIKRREHVRAIEVNVSERAEDVEKYVSKRDELWFLMREWLQAGGVLPENKRLHAELVTPTYCFDNKGRYKVESKKDIKERVSGHRSPDVADSACLSIAKVMRQSRGTALRDLASYRRKRVI